MAYSSDGLALVAYNAAGGSPNRVWFYREDATVASITGASINYFATPLAAGEMSLGDIIFVFGSSNAVAFGSIGTGGNVVPLTAAIAS